MKKIICLLLAVVMLVACCAVFIGCGAPKDAGAEINVYLGNDVYDLDPGDYYADSNAEQLMSLVFEPLFRINEKGKLECAAAKKYDVDEEKREIVIELRESYWSDDIRVKAADFVYAWCERLLDPNEPNAAAPLLYDIENAADAKCGIVSLSNIGVDASDIYELTITYREGADYNALLRNLASVATSPIRQEIVEANPTIWSKMVGRVFNGPFKVIYSDHNSGEFTLGRNLGYHQKPTVEDYDNEVTPAQVISFLTLDGADIEVSYADLAQKVTFFMSDATLADRAANKNNAIVKDDASTYSYVFDTTNPLFANAKVRQALSLAIDRDAIVAAITFGKAANGFIPDAFGGSSENLISSAANKARAEELLDEVDLTGISKSFTLTVNNDEESLRIADIVAACWNDLGFRVSVVPAEIQKITVAETEYCDSGIQVLVKEASYGNIEYDVIGIDWQMYSSDPFVALASFMSGFGGGGVDFSSHTSRKGISGWANTDYDYLISAAYRTTDAAERASLLCEAEKLLCEEAPVIPVVFNQTFAFVSKEISKVKFDGLGNYVLTEVKQKNYRDYLPSEEE